MNHDSGAYNRDQHIILITLTELQPSTAISNQLPSQLVLHKLEPKTYKFIIALRMLNILII